MLLFCHKVNTCTFVQMKSHATENSVETYEKISDKCASSFFFSITISITLSSVERVE